MSMRTMDEVLPESTVRTHANFDEDGARIDPVSKPTLVRAASQVFDNGMEQWGKAEAFASRLGTPKSTVSEWRKGTRPVPFAALLGLFDNGQARALVVKATCELAGYPMPVRDTVSLTTSQAVELSRMRDFMGEMWPHAGAAYAARYYRCSLDLLEAAIDGALRAAK